MNNLTYSIHEEDPTEHKTNQANSTTTKIRVQQQRRRHLIKNKMMTTTTTTKAAATTMMTLLFVISIVFTPLFITPTIAFVPSLLRPRHSSASTNTAATTMATMLVGGMTTKNTALAMFTGIVEEMGTVVNMEERNDMTLWDGSKGKGTELTVRGNVVMEGAYLGCSICVSGVCLTATVLDPTQNIFTVGLAPETLDKTYFRTLQRGQLVNLERASEIGGRNSGHFVQGHVDGTGTIVEKRIDGDSLRITVQVDEEHVDNIVRYIVPKGFIAIDGTSLTVVDVDTELRTFSFMLVEYTQKKIIIPNKLIGEKVNLEVDVLGKYSETAMSALLPRMEALEAKVESLERRLSAATSGSSSSGGGGGGGGGNDKQNRMRPSSSSTAAAAATRNAAPDAAFTRPKRMGITEGTPTFKDNIGDQGGLTVDPNTYMMRAKGRERGAAPKTNNEDDGSDGTGSSHRVSLNPDPKMDDNNGRSRMSGDNFVTIS